MGKGKTNDSPRDDAGRTTAEIEANIERTRSQLADTLDELAMRVHPSTVAAQTKAKVVGAVEEKLGRLYVGASRGVEQVKAQFVDDEGKPRPERIVPAVLVGGGVLLLLASARKRRRG
ncbi:hypothetical protein C7C46_07770 [Streptomyces tateyamensis]|uniref:DUF3618 domain-containing protein n=1 Tax=Streptomyces tateyamensis TaxID=565073 RepID=A0A2V4P3Q5_9ACTN|nr:DUF3618 domain-containing protein [Streptomyces tateyamensis]PYC84373.1 hypothetical protein C7C46_07770 [Streptomyces tateyamensis]